MRKRWCIVQTGIFFLHSVFVHDTRTRRYASSLPSSGPLYYPFAISIPIWQYIASDFWSRHVIDRCRPIVIGVVGSRSSRRLCAWKSVGWVFFFISVNFSLVNGPCTAIALYKHTRARAPPHHPSPDPLYSVPLHVRLQLCARLCVCPLPPARDVQRRVYPPPLTAVRPL